MTYWRRPGKDEGWSATTGHCKGLKVFTTSTEFGIQGTHTKLHAYMVLNHAGDYSEGIKALVKAGYGTWIDADGKEHQNPPPKSEQARLNAAACADKMAVAASDPSHINLTEWGNAQRLVNRFRDEIRYCPERGKWFVWAGSHWKLDEDGGIWRRAKETVRGLAKLAADTADDKERMSILRWALISESKKVLDAAIQLAWSEEGVSITTGQMDVNPWLLNCPNGTVDLMTGVLRPHSRADLITKSTLVPVDMEADCPWWKKVLLEIFAGDQSMVDYMQRALGYSMTGTVGEHCLFIPHGAGRNGKNTITDTALAVAGDYSRTTDPKHFMSGKDEHPVAIADLVGRRFVQTDEVEDGARLAEALVKRVTGNAILNARFMRQNPFEFPVQFKLWMPCNHKPDIKGLDEGIWSRVRLIPFDVYFPPEKRIKDLSRKLVEAEGPAILGWLVKGCLEWQRIGLAEPKKVLDGTKAYRNEQDLISAFVHDQCVDHKDSAVGDKAKVLTGVLYERYVAWCKDAGEKTVLTSRKFGSEMERRGFKLVESNSKSYRTRIALRSGDASPSGKNEGQPE